MTLDGFETPFQTELDENNRWVKMSCCIPWDELARAYYKGLSPGQGRPAKDARLVIGAVIIKHKLNLSDEETVFQIQENPYLQFFVGLPRFQVSQPFASSLFVEIRRRMGAEMFKEFEQAIVDRVEDRRKRKRPRQNDSDPPTGDSCEKKRSGKLIVDATVAEQAIRYPTDLSLLNESREISERILDNLYRQSNLSKKPRTYRRKARQAYLAVVKQRRPGANVRRRAIREQLQYLRRNIGHIEELLDILPGVEIPLPYKMLRQYWIIQQVYAQQEEMYRNGQRRCDNRIVSIHQPHVRPIVRGKVNKSVEFGAKLNVSLSESGLASVDHVRWDAYNEGADLQFQVEHYKKVHGDYPEAVLADPIYGTRENRRYLKSHSIRFAGKPLGRPKKQTEENKLQIREAKKQRREEYRQRIPIEGKFGQGKNGYRLNYIKAKTAKTSEAWIRSIFLVMNLLVLIKVFILPCRLAVTRFVERFVEHFKRGLRTKEAFSFMIFHDRSLLRRTF